MEPDVCTISYDCPCANDYCQDCSHATWFGRGKDRNGKLWLWEFSPRLGPLFLRKDGVPLVYQPIDEDHPAWEPFEKWRKKALHKPVLNHEDIGVAK